MHYVIGIDPAAPDGEMCGCLCPKCRRPLMWKPVKEKPPAKCPHCRKPLNWRRLKIVK